MQSCSGVDIEEVRSDYFRVPLPVPLSDSTHGLMPNFELIVVRVRDADGAEGVGYTYTAGRNGRAILAVASEIAELARGKDADLSEFSLELDLVGASLRWQGRTHCMCVVGIRHGDMGS